MSLAISVLPTLHHVKGPMGINADIKSYKLCTLMLFIML